ncbi:MAG: hypothetical protein JO207_08385 [Verrucomicrobia bacterium]|jgi:hypothetical protein|nr:hypothetical protein [Verrucomicrobiota bacterium]
MNTPTPPQRTNPLSPESSPATSRPAPIDPVRVLKRIGNCNICTHTDDELGFFYASGLNVDADGSPHAYHPDGISGLDHLGNAGRPGNWWALVTHDGKASGNPVIQKANDPAPGFYVSTTSLQNPSFDRKDPRRYVNSEAISFIVLPAGLNLGAKLGDYAVVIRPETGAIAYAVYADVGPAGKIGEGSIALANALGVPSSAKTGGVASGIIYLVLPGSADAFPSSQADIDTAGAAFLAIWGGLDRVRDKFSKMKWA